MKKIISTLIVISLLLGTIGNNAYAVAQSINNVQQEENSASKFSEGKITNVNDTGSIATVVNIQDLHCHYQTQQNISDIIKEIDDNYSIKAICVEGGYGQIDTSWLSDIKDENLKQKITDKLLSEGELTGAEYYVVKNNKKDILKGLDDEKTHKENIKRLSNIIENETKYAQTIQKVRYIINKLNNEYVNKNSRKFTDTVNKYRQEKIDTSEYYGLLWNYIDKINKEPQKYNNIIKISKTDYPNISKYLQLTKNNKKIKTKQVGVELQQVLNDLKQKLSYKEFSTMVADTKNFKQSDKLISYIQYYNNEKKIDLEKYVQLNNFVKLNYINNSLNPVEMIKEEALLEDQIRKALSYNLTEYEIAYITSFEDYFEKYLNYALTCIEWKYTEAGMEKFRRIYSKYAVVDRIKEIEKDFDNINKYYQANETRNSIFIDNITKYISDNTKINTKQKRTAEQILKDSKEVIVVVSGGYHSEELKDMLSDKNINDIVITPNVIGDIDISSDKYKQIIKGQGKIQSQALAYTLSSCMSEQYKKALLYKIASNLVDETTFEQIKKEINKGQYQENENIVEEFLKDKDEYFVNSFNKKAEKIEDIIKENISELVNLSDPILFYENFDRYILKIVELLTNEGFLFDLQKGAAFEMENSPLKDRTLLGISPEIYSYMPKSVQLALRKIFMDSVINDGENIFVIKFNNSDNDKKEKQNIKITYKLNSSQRIEEQKELTEDSQLCLQLGNLGKEREKRFPTIKDITEVKRLNKRLKNKLNSIKQENNILDKLNDSKQNILYLDDIIKPDTKTTSVSIVKREYEDGRKYDDVLILKYDESQKAWFIVPHDELQKEYKNIETYINDEIKNSFLESEEIKQYNNDNFLKKFKIESLKDEKRKKELYALHEKLQREIEKSIEKFQDKNKISDKDNYNYYDLLVAIIAQGNIRANNDKTEETIGERKIINEIQKTKGYAAEILLAYVCRDISLLDDYNAEGYDLINSRKYKVQLKCGQNDIVNKALTEFPGIPVFAPKSVANQFKENKEERVFGYDLSEDFFYSATEYVINNIDKLNLKEINEVDLNIGVVDNEQENTPDKIVDNILQSENIRTNVDSRIRNVSETVQEEMDDIFGNNENESLRENKVLYNYALEFLNKCNDSDRRSAILEKVIWEYKIDAIQILEFLLKPENIKYINESDNVKVRFVVEYAKYLCLFADQDVSLEDFYDQMSYAIKDFPNMGIKEYQITAANDFEIKTKIINNLKELSAYKSDISREVYFLYSSVELAPEIQITLAKVQNYFYPIAEILGIKNINLYTDVLRNMHVEQLEEFINLLKQLNADEKRKINELFSELKRLKYTGIDTEKNCLALKIFLIDDFENMFEENFEDFPASSKYKTAVALSQIIPDDISENIVNDILKQQRSNKVIKKQVKKVTEYLQKNIFETYFQLYLNTFKKYYNKAFFEDGETVYVANAKGFSSVGTDLLKGRLKNVGININVFDKHDGHKINSSEKFLNLISGSREHYADKSQKYTYIFNGHSNANNLIFEYEGNIIKDSANFEQTATAILNAKNNGAVMKNITLNLTSCDSYNFAGKLIDEIIKQRKQELKEDLKTDEEIKQIIEKELKNEQLLPTIITATNQDYEYSSSIDFKDVDGKIYYGIASYEHALIQYIDSNKELIGKNLLIKDFLLAGDMYTHSTPTVIVFDSEFYETKQQVDEYSREILNIETNKEENIFNKFFKFTLLSIFSNNQILNKYAPIWEEPVFRTLAAGLSVWLNSNSLFLAFQGLFIFSHTIVRWIEESKQTGDWNIKQLGTFAIEDLKTLGVPTILVNVSYIIPLAILSTVFPFLSPVALVIIPTAFSMAFHYVWNKYLAPKFNMQKMSVFNKLWEKIKDGPDSRNWYKIEELLDNKKWFEKERETDFVSDNENLFYAIINNLSPLGKLKQYLEVFDEAEQNGQDKLISADANLLIQKIENKEINSYRDFENIINLFKSMDTFDYRTKELASLIIYPVTKNNDTSKTKEMFNFFYDNKNFLEQNYDLVKTIYENKRLNLEEKNSLILSLKNNEILSLLNDIENPEQRKKLVEKITSSNYFFKFFDSENDGTVISRFGGKDLNLEDDISLIIKRKILAKLYTARNLFTPQQQKQIFKNETIVKDILEIRDFDKLNTVVKQMLLDGSIKSQVNLKEYLVHFNGELLKGKQNPDIARNIDIAKQRNINDINEVRVLFNSFVKNKQYKNYNNYNGVFEKLTGFSVEQIIENEKGEKNINGRKYAAGDILEIYRDDIVYAIATIAKNNNINFKDIANKNIITENYNFKCPLFDGPSLVPYSEILKSGYVIGDCTGSLAEGANNIEFRNNRIYIKNHLLFGYYKDGSLVQKYGCHYNDEVFHIFSLEDIGGFRPWKTENKSGYGSEYKNITFEGKYFFESIGFIYNFAEQVCNTEDVYIETITSNSKTLKDLAKSITAISTSKFSKNGNLLSQYFANGGLKKIKIEKLIKEVGSIENNERKAAVVKLLDKYHKYSGAYLKNTQNEVLASKGTHDAKVQDGKIIINNTGAVYNNFISNFVDIIENVPVYNLKNNQKGFALPIGENKLLEIHIDEVSELVMNKKGYKKTEKGEFAKQELTTVDKNIKEQIINNVNNYFYKDINKQRFGLNNIDSVEVAGINGQNEVFLILKDGNKQIYIKNDKTKIKSKKSKINIELTEDTVYKQQQINDYNNETIDEQISFTQYLKNKHNLNSWENKNEIIKILTSSSDYLKQQLRQKLEEQVNITIYLDTVENSVEIDNDIVKEFKEYDVSEEKLGVILSRENSEDYQNALKILDMIKEFGQYGTPVINTIYLDEKYKLSDFYKKQVYGKPFIEDRNSINRFLLCLLYDYPLYENKKRYELIENNKIILDFLLYGKEYVEQNYKNGKILADNLNNLYRFILKRPTNGMVLAEVDFDGIMALGNFIGKYAKRKEKDLNVLFFGLEKSEIFSIATQNDCFILRAILNDNFNDALREQNKQFGRPFEILGITDRYYIAEVFGSFISSLNLHKEMIERLFEDEQMMNLFVESFFKIVNIYKNEELSSNGMEVYYLTHEEDVFTNKVKAKVFDKAQISVVKEEIYDNPADWLDKIENSSNDKMLKYFHFFGHGSVLGLNVTRAGTERITTPSSIISAMKEQYKIETISKVLNDNRFRNNLENVKELLPIDIQKQIENKTDIYDILTIFANALNQNTLSDAILLQIFDGSLNYDITETLIKAQQNGISLDTIVLDFGACESVYFANDMYKDLIRKGAKSLPKIVVASSRSNPLSHAIFKEINGTQYSINTFDQNLLNILNGKGSITYKDIFAARENSTVYFELNDKAKEIIDNLKREISSFEQIQQPYFLELYQGQQQNNIIGQIRTKVGVKKEMFADDWNVEKEEVLTYDGKEYIRPSVTKMPYDNDKQRYKGVNYFDEYMKVKNLKFEEFINGKSEDFDKGIYDGFTYAYIHYLFINKKYKELKNFVENSNNALKYRLFALMYLKAENISIGEFFEFELKQNFKYEIEGGLYRKNIKNDFDLRAYNTGMLLLCEEKFKESINILNDDIDTSFNYNSIMKNLYGNILNSVFLLPKPLLTEVAYSDLSFSSGYGENLKEAIRHELQHRFIRELGFENINEMGLSVNEALSYISARKYRPNNLITKVSNKILNYFVPEDLKIEYSSMAFNMEQVFGEKFADIFNEIISVIGEPVGGINISDAMMKLMFSDKNLENNNLSQLELRNKIFDIYLEDKDEEFIKNFEKAVNELDFGWQSVLYNTLNYLKQNDRKTYDDIIERITKLEIEASGRNKSYNYKFAENIDKKIANGDDKAIISHIILTENKPDKRILDIISTSLPKEQTGLTQLFGKDKFLKYYLSNTQNKEYLKKIIKNIDDEKIQNALLAKTYNVEKEEIISEDFIKNKAKEFSKITKENDEYKTLWFRDVLNKLPSFFDNRKLYAFVEKLNLNNQEHKNILKQIIKQQGKIDRVLFLLDAINLTDEKEKLFVNDIIEAPKRNYNPLKKFFKRRNPDKKVNIIKTTEISEMFNLKEGNRIFKEEEFFDSANFMTINDFLFNDTKYDNSVILGKSKMFLKSIADICGQPAWNEYYTEELSDIVVENNNKKREALVRKEGVTAAPEILFFQIYNDLKSNKNGLEKIYFFLPSNVDEDFDKTNFTFEELKVLLDMKNSEDETVKDMADYILEHTVFVLGTESLINAMKFLDLNVNDLSQEEMTTIFEIMVDIKKEQDKQNNIYDKEAMISESYVNKGSKLLKALITSISSIFATKINVHTILDFKTIKTKQELVGVTSDGILSSVKENLETQQNAEKEISLPIYIISDALEGFAYNNELDNIGLKTEKGESIFAVKNDSAIILGTKSGAGAFEIARIINGSKALEDLVKDKIGKNTDINFDIIVEDEKYMKEKQKDKSLKDSNIIFENGITIINETESQTQQEIINKFKYLSSVKQTIGFTLADKMVISLEQIINVENLKQALNNGKARKVITEQQYNDLGLNEAELFNLRENGIEVYIKYENKIVEFDTNNEVDLEQVDKNITIQGLQEKIVTSQKPILIDIEQLKNVFKNIQTSDILNTYSMFETLIGNMKITLGIKQLTLADVREMAYNIPFENIPESWDDLSQTDNIIGIYNDINDNFKETFKKVIEERIKAKNIIEQLNTEYTDGNNAVKKLEKLLIKVINKQDKLNFETLQIKKNQIKQEIESNDKTLEQNKVDLWNNLIKQQISEDAIATALYIMDIIADDNRQTQNIKKDNNDISKDYRAMLSAA